MEKIILAAQFAVSALLVASVLLQRRGAGSSAITGGSDVTFYKKRGAEKVLYWASIVFGGLFIALGIANLLI